MESRAETAQEASFWRQHRRLLQRADRELLRMGIARLRFKDPDTGESYEEKMVDPNASVFNIFTDEEAQED